MATSEIVINEYLGAELRQQYQRWQKEGAVRSENTEAFAEKSQRPDLIVCDNPMAPVAVETEFFPANTVEADALGRLGKIYLPTGGKIHTVIAVRLPTKYRQLTGGSIGEALANEQGLQYCLLSGESKPQSHRWPASGYITGSVTDIAYVIATAKVSPVTVAQGAELLEQGARRLAAMLSSAVASNPGLGTRIAAHLKQEPGPQTYAMAATILINAFVFQDTIAGTSPELSEIKSIHAIGSGTRKPTKMEVLAEWDRILSVNYWPIFGIAKKLISAVPPPIWDIFSESSLTTADQLLSLNLGKDPDLVGTIFQRLIMDRRFLATFYTAPSSATLLSDLMIGEQVSNGLDWSQVGVKNLKLADFACGTGSLLCALYAELRTRLENAGVDSRSIHRWMVENALVGCDVIPSATYITASQMSSVYPTIQYTTTKILTMPFGRLADGGVALGSLDLLEKQGAISVISTSAGEVGAQSDAEVHAWKAVGGVAVDDQSFDLIAMNPPFTRLTGGGGKSIDISRPLFAAFGTTPSDQSAMAKKAAKLFKGTVYHGNAGAASAFVEIGHRKLNYGGTIGLILPISALCGISWEPCRDLWRKHYRDIITLTIASDEPGASAFSADTGIAECMFVGTRCDTPDGQVVSVSLSEAGLQS